MCKPTLARNLCPNVFVYRDCNFKNTLKFSIMSAVPLNAKYFSNSAIIKIEYLKIYFNETNLVTYLAFFFEMKFNPLSKSDNFFPK